MAESFAKAGHRVVLVRTDGAAREADWASTTSGLAQALLYERLNVLDLLQPSVEPLLSLLSDGGFTAQSRELLVADRVRAVLSPLIDAGHLVVIQSPGIGHRRGRGLPRCGGPGPGRRHHGPDPSARARARREAAATRGRPPSRRWSSAGAAPSKRTRLRVPAEDVDSDVRQPASTSHDQVTRARR